MDQEIPRKGEFQVPSGVQELTSVPAGNFQICQHPPSDNLRACPIQDLRLRAERN
jgi:hypothetical protein